MLRKDAGQSENIHNCSLSWSPRVVTLICQGCANPNANHRRHNTNTLCSSVQLYMNLNSGTKVLQLQEQLCLHNCAIVLYCNSIVLCDSIAIVIASKNVCEQLYDSNGITNYTCM